MNFEAKITITASELQGVFKDGYDRGNTDGGRKEDKDINSYDRQRWAWESFIEDCPKQLRRFLEDEDD